MIKLNYTYLLLALCFAILTTCQTEVDKEVIRQEILKNGQVIREAFAKGNIAKIKALHHPEVKKALGYKDIKNGREAVIKGIEETLQYYSLEFIENEVEHILIQNDLVIEQSRFSIQGTPKNEGDSFVFSGRTMVTYVRYEDSPTGWATIREIIQPATN